MADGQDTAVTVDDVVQYVETLPGVRVDRPVDGPGAGDVFVRYDPDDDLAPERQFPFVTIVTKDYAGFDEASRLDRPGAWRLNIGVSVETFRHLFGHGPAEEPATPYDFAAPDTVTPHPAYGAQAWLCVVLPGPETFRSLRPLIVEAHGRAVRRHGRTGPATR